MARFTADTPAQIIVVCGVRFMTETAKLLCPERTVLLPASQAGCSLAERDLEVQCLHIQSVRPMLTWGSFDPDQHPAAVMGTDFGSWAPAVLPVGHVTAGAGAFNLAESLTSCACC